LNAFAELKLNEPKSHNIAKIQDLQTILFSPQRAALSKPDRILPQEGSGL